MEYFTETLVVLAILVAVAVAAVKFEPADPLDYWRRLAERYGSGDRPATVQYPMQQVHFGGVRGTPKPLGPSATFDVAIDDFGLWIAARGIEAGDVAATLRIPGTHVRPAGRRGQAYLFKLFAEPPVRIAVADELGADLLQKTRSGPVVG